MLISAMYFILCACRVEEDIKACPAVLRSVPKGCQLVLIGDADQLPSVGPGAVLSEIIKSDVIPVVRLDRVHRQNAGSRIATNAKLIRHGNLSLEYGTDFQFLDSSSIAESAEKIEKLYLQEIAKYGMTKEDFNVRIDEDNNLVISMEKKSESKEEQKEHRYLRREFSYSKFQQTMILPDDVDKEKIAAGVEHGVLTIDLPKLSLEEIKKAERTIEIK